MSNHIFDMNYDPITNPNAPRDTAIGMFYKDKIKDDMASKKEGRTVWRDVVMVKIRVPGDKFNEPIHVATDEHKKRFPRAWDAFEKQQSSAVEGTPIEMWPPVSDPALVANLKACDIVSVEILSELNETKLPNIPNIMRLKQMARDWLNSAKGNADAVRVGEELREALARNDRLEERIGQLEAALDAFKGEAPRQKRKYTKRAATDRPE